ncbi:MULTISPECIES: GNAT family N-acetyltransferase [Aphanothece]|uniref:GNAT family N-acetyltransferase n=1 Tax=Aphanothece TaxID=1121 RepID=UPI0039847BB1
MAHPTPQPLTFDSLDTSSRVAIAELFTLTFTASEGEREGLLVGNLASALAGLIDDQEVMAIGAHQGGALVGCVIFSRLRFAHASLTYMLAPVAVHPDRQRQGIGSRLILGGLGELRRRAVAVVVTYGDPAFYGKAGFQPIAPDTIQPPFPLSQPQGWLGCSLTGEPLPALSGRPTCVKPFRNPAYW